MLIKVTVIPTITGKLTRAPLSLSDVEFLKESSLEDKLADTLVTNAESFQIDMLLGNDYYFTAKEDGHGKWIIPVSIQIGLGVWRKSDN